MSDVLNTYEKKLVNIMIDEQCSFVEAMDIIFDMYGVDKTSVFDLVDFLEDQLYNLNTVEYYMNVWLGKENDMVLKVNNNAKAKGE